MEEKKYLKWYNKVGYGSGDLAGNVVYAFLSSFVMLYLTNTVGLNPGIIGTLIMVSKLFDGISDMFFGTMIDKTKSKLGKARPWMLYAYIGCAVTLVANFAIPASLGRTAQYAWFFIAYTMLNAVFFTANNIAYASLVTFCTRNSKERVEMGSFRFIFAFSTSLIIQSVTVQFVRALGNGASAWKTVAIIYAVIGLPANLFYNTSIPTCIIVLKKHRDGRDVLFIDASKKFDKGKKQNEMTDVHINEVMELYSKRETVEKESFLASFEEIEKNDFNLNIPRYVDNFEKEEEIDLNDLLSEMKKTDDELEKTQGEFLALLRDLTSTDDAIMKSLDELIAKMEG